MPTQSSTLSHARLKLVSKVRYALRPGRRPASTQRAQYPLIKEYPLIQRPQTMITNHPQLILGILCMV